MTHVEVLQGGRDMEIPLPQKCVAIVGSDDGQQPVCDGIRVDVQREHQRVHQGAQGCESVRACRFWSLLFTLR